MEKLYLFYDGPKFLFKFLEFGNDGSGFTTFKSVRFFIICEQSGIICSVMSSFSFVSFQIIPYSPTEVVNEFTSLDYTLALVFFFVRCRNIF